MTELKRLWNMNLESVAGRLNSLFVLSKDTQLFTVGTNSSGNIPVAARMERDSILSHPCIQRMHAGTNTGHCNHAAASHHLSRLRTGLL